MGEKVTPKVDLAFKKIFGVEENKDLLISLINSIVSEQDQVTDIILKNPYNAKKFKKDKLSVLDIKAQGHDGKQFNVEIQIADEHDYAKRSLYYWGRFYTDQLKESGSYSDLKRTIGIHILNFTSIPHSEKYHCKFNLKEETEGFAYFDDIELHTIELNKFSKGMSDDYDTLISKIKSSLDMWLAFLTRYDLLDPAKSPIDASVTKALHVLDTINFSDEEREVYRERLDWLRLEASALEKFWRRGRG